MSSDLGIVGDSDGSGAEDAAMRELAQNASIHSHYSPDDLQQHLHHASASSAQSRNSVHSHHSHHSLRKSLEHPGGKSSFQSLSDHRVHAEESYPLPPSSLPQVAPTTSPGTKKKGVAALLKGLRSGEVSKIVDNMDSANAAQNNQVAARHSMHSHHSAHSHHSQHQSPSNGSLHTSPHRHSLSNEGLHLGQDLSESFVDSGVHVPPPRSSPVPQASAATKRKGAAALLKGLRSGEVSKIVDNMETANEIAQAAETSSNNHSPTRPEQLGTSPLGSPRHRMLHHSPRTAQNARNSAPVNSNFIAEPPQARRSLQHSNLGQASLRQPSPYDTFFIGSHDNRRNERGSFDRTPTQTTVHEDLTMNMTSSDSHEDLASRGPHLLG